MSKPVSKVVLIIITIAVSMVLGFDCEEGAHPVERGTVAIEAGLPEAEDRLIQDRPADRYPSPSTPTPRHRLGLALSSITLFTQIQAMGNHPNNLTLSHGESREADIPAVPSQTERISFIRRRVIPLFKEIRLTPAACRSNLPEEDGLSFYSRRIFPRICDWVMGLTALAELRQTTLADVGGDILEIGFGTGRNLAHYPGHVRRITTVEPNLGMNSLALKRAARSGIQVDQRRLGGESMPFDEGTFDSVVSTWTMCSIPEVERALGEVYRVLRPGGRLIFLEHGQSDIAKVRAWQRRLNPIERVLGDGCHLDRDIAAIVQSQPFRQFAFDRFELNGLPRTHGTMYRGSATK